MRILLPTPHLQVPLLRGLFGWHFAFPKGIDFELAEVECPGRRENYLFLRVRHNTHLLHLFHLFRQLPRSNKNLKQKLRHRDCRDFRGLREGL